jgi:hypothetical protein
MNDDWLVISDSTQIDVNYLTCIVYKSPEEWGIYEWAEGDQEWVKTAGPENDA